MKFFFYIFAIHSSSRHEKRCQMRLRLFSLFQGSIYQQCSVTGSSVTVGTTVAYYLNFLISIGQLGIETKLQNQTYSIILLHTHFTTWKTGTAKEIDFISL